jgi:hypothetical protein
MGGLNGLNFPDPTKPRGNGMMLDENVVMKGGNDLAGVTFGLGGVTAPIWQKRTRTLNTFLIGGTTPLARCVTIIGFRIIQLSWSPAAPPTLDGTSGAIFLDCPELSSPESTWLGTSRSMIGAWNLSPLVNAGPSFISKSRDILLNSPTELNRITLLLYNMNGIQVPLTTNNNCNVTIEFILPN